MSKLTDTLKLASTRVVNMVIFVGTFLKIVLLATVRAVLPYSMQYQRDLTGETIVLTGSAGHLGRQLAKQLAVFNCRLILVDMMKEVNEGVAEETRAYPETKAEIIPLACDLSQASNCYSLIDKIQSEIGDIDMLIHNAGICKEANIQDIDDEHLERICRTNCMSHFWLGKAVLPRMKERRKGHLVGMGSITGFSGFPRMGAYSASKAFVLGFFETLRLELSIGGYEDIRTTYVGPYFINSGMFGHFGQDVLALPALEAEETARQTIGAIRAEKLIKTMPFWTYLIIAFKGILPSDSLIYATKETGILYAFENREKMMAKPANDQNNNR